MTPHRGKIFRDLSRAAPAKKDDELVEKDTYHNSEIRNGFNQRLQKHFIQIIDIETEHNSKIYLDEESYRDFAHAILDDIKRIRDLGLKKE